MAIEDYDSNKQRLITIIGNIKEDIGSADKLINNLNEELSNVEMAKDEYDNIYVRLCSAGKTLVSATNVSILNSGYSFLERYYHTIEDAISEVSAIKSNFSRTLSVEQSNLIKLNKKNK